MKAKKERSGRVTYSVKEVADRLGIGIKQAFAGVKAGEIPHLRVGNRILVPAAQLQRMLEGEAA